MSRADYLREMHEAKARYEYEMLTARDAFLSLTAEERADPDISARYTGLKQWFAQTYRMRRAALIAEQSDQELPERAYTTVAPGNDQTPS